MDLLVVHRHFWPSDLPYAQMLKEFALFAKNAGHSVTVLAPCESPEDLVVRQNWAAEIGVQVVSRVLESGQGKRLLGKAIIYVKYLIWLRQILRNKSPEMVWIASTPPVFAAALVRLRYAGTPTRYIYHCQDIHPEASLAIGKLGRGHLYRWLVSVDKRNVDEAMKVVVLSHDMRNVLETRDKSPLKGNIQVINNFVRANLFESTALKLVPDEQDYDKDVPLEHPRPRWLFAGTLGHFQNLELFVDALLATDVKRCPEVTFLGGGALKESLKNKVPALRRELIRFLDPVDSETAQRRMREYDVGIVSLAPGIINCAYPSKALNYLAAGLKVFAIIESESELGRFLTDENIGFVSDSSVAESLARDIESAVDSDALKPNPDLCTTTAKQHFDMESILARYERLLVKTGL